MYVNRINNHRTNPRVSTAIPVLAIAFLLYGTSMMCQTAASAGDWKQVEDAMGRPGQAQPGDVIRFGMPRKDFPHVVLNGVEIKAGLALGSWAAFKRNGSEPMVVGDLVLAEDEVEPVMMKLQQGGIQQSALHKHLLGESPHVMYLHIESQGDPVEMAKAIREVLALTKTPAPDASPADPVSLRTRLRPKAGRADHRALREGEWRNPSDWSAEGGNDHGVGRGDSALNGRGNRIEPPTHRWWKGGDHRRFRSARN
jgi:hypothetical protein